MSFVAAAATVGGAVGLTGTAAIIGGGALMGAGAGGLYSAITGDGNVFNSMLTGGLLGMGAGGIGAAAAGAAGAGAIGAEVAAPLAGEAIAAPLTGANVAGTAALTPEAIMGSTGFVPSAGSGASFAMPGGSYIPTAIPAAFTPAEYASQYAVQDLEGAMLNAGDVEAQVGGFYGGQAPANPYANMSDAQLTKVLQEGSSSGITAGDVFKAKTAKDLSEGEIPGWAKLGAGALGLGYLMQQNNNKYGTTNDAPYSGNSLASFNYDRTKYTPLTTPQPSPAYQAQYSNYVKTPYNAYAAKGGHVRSYAQGGIASAAPMANPSIGPVEQMSRNNATGSNQMFPQASINSPAFATATNTPMGSNMITSASDVSVDPYTGQQRFAAGGLAATKRYADGGNITPDQITANSVSYNNALMEQLQGALTTPVPQMNPGQVAQQAPLQVPTGASLQQTPYQAAPAAQSYQGYGAPSFTRTDVPTIPFANPGIIQGTKAYNDRIAEEAAKKAAEESMFRFTPVSDGGGGAKAGGLMPKALRYDLGGFIEQAATLPLNQAQTAMDNPGQALIGANTPFETSVWNGVTGSKMRPTVDMYGRPIDEFGQLKKYAGGGKIPNHMEAIDNYMAQYQTDPAKVISKAKSGDYNAMIALNKINDTPNQNYAAGGHLGSYSDGGRMLKGPGDGMSDNIPATIGGKQPARLADGEFVVPADVVSHLGNGSTDAGAKHLYNMMDKVRKARTGSKKQGKEIKPEKFLKG